MSGVRRRRWRRFSSEPLEVGQPEIDQRLHAILETRLTRKLQCLFVALARLGRGNALFEAIVTRHDQLLDLVPLRLFHAEERSFACLREDPSAVEAVAIPRTRPVRVLVADDEPLFIETVKALLADDERVQVVGTASNGEDAVDLAVALGPDLILMDISMPVLDGIEAARRIRIERPSACILILTGSSIAADVDRARQAGVAGFLTKDRLGSQLVEAILDLGTN
jgi:CheY-like chemotaxis protein